MQLYWAGHVTRMEDVRMPKAVFFSKLQEGKRNCGAPRKRCKRSAEETACTSGNQPLAMAAGGLRPRQLVLICEKSLVVSSRQRGMKPQRKDAGGRKSEQHPYHPHPKPSSVQSAAGCAHQETVSTATNERARTDHRPSQQSSSAWNEPPPSS